MSTTDQEMSKILIEEVATLGIPNAEDVIGRLLDLERDSVTSEDRRPTLKRVSDLIDEALAIGG